MKPYKIKSQVILKIFAFVLEQICIFQNKHYCRTNYSSLSLTRVYIRVTMMKISIQSISIIPQRLLVHLVLISAFNSAPSNNRFSFCHWSLACCRMSYTWVIQCDALFSAWLLLLRVIWNWAMLLHVSIDSSFFLIAAILFIV